MKAKVLDNRVDGGSECFLCRLTLEEYVTSLPTTYQDYDVQREIVSNVYLDHLVDTVLARKHIPPIVLVGSNHSREGDELALESFKILDGLQRTFRLQAISQTITYCLNRIINPQETLEWNKFKFSRTFSADLRALNSNTDVLRPIVQFLVANNSDALKKTFSENQQWFEVWTGLSPDEEVRKMLVLNAGHKPVKTRHQLELLFLNLLPTLRSGEGEKFRIVREREVSSPQFSKQRQIGSFHFAHIISSLLSLYEGKPVTPSTELIQELQTNDPAFEEYAQFINPEFLKDFVDFLVRLDQLLSDQYGEFGILWMGREVSLAGLFGALGSIAKNSERPHKEVMQQFSDLVENNLGTMNLEEFEEARNDLDLSKVNFGNVNRGAVFAAVQRLLTERVPTKIDWRAYFGSDGK
jgi:hypothetical protein